MAQRWGTMESKYAFTSVHRIIRSICMWGSWKSFRWVSLPGLRSTIYPIELVTKTMSHFPRCLSINIKYLTVNVKKRSLKPESVPDKKFQSFFITVESRFRITYPAIDFFIEFLEKWIRVLCTILPYVKLFCYEILGIFDNLNSTPYVLCWRSTLYKTCASELGVVVGEGWRSIEIQHQKPATQSYSLERGH